MPLISITLFCILILFSSYTDLKYRKIYNFITIPFIIGGFIGNFLAYGLSGLIFSFYGFITGLFIFFPLFVLNLLGGGDIKLMSAIGAILGVKLVLLTGIYSLIFGGIMSIVVLIYNKKLVKTLKQAFWALFTLINPRLSLELPKASNSTKTPFAIAIGIGGIVAIYCNFWNACLF